MRRIPAGIVLSLALLAGCRGGSGDPIVIGVAGPLSLPNGRSMKLAAQMAVDEINQANGIDGRRLELNFQDDGGDANQAIRVATVLRDSTDAVAVIGHVNSGATLKAATVYNEEEGEHGKPPIPQISPASSSPQISQSGPWTFRVCPSDLLHGPTLAGWTVSRLGRRHAAVLYTNDDYGRGVTETFAAAFQKDGGSVVSRDPYLKATVDAPGSVDAYLTRAMRRGMDALVIAGQADAGAKIVAAARRMGFTGPVLGPDGMTGIKDAGAEAEGVYVSSAFLADASSPNARKFVGDYLNRFHELPDHRGAMTYDAIKLVAQAIQNAGADRKSIRDYLEQVGRDDRHPALDGVSGRIAFDENGDVPQKEVVMGVVRGGKLVTAK